MVVPVSDWVVGTIALIAVSTGFIFHLVWKHGWGEGFQAGGRIKTTEDGEERQPAVKSLVGFLYALGWHLGWDYGFRKGLNSSNTEVKKRTD